MDERNTMIENRQRHIQKLIRLDEQENDFIMDKVKSSGIKSFQNYARHMLIQGKVITNDYSELIGFRKEVNSIGRNVNQIIKYVNTSGEIGREEFTFLMSQVDEMKQVVAKFIDSERVIHESEVL